MFSDIVAFAVGKAVVCTVCWGQVSPPSCVQPQHNPKNLGIVLYLLHLDGSGSVKNPNERYFVLAGVSVFERQIFHLIKKSDEFVADLNLGDPHDIELHGSVMANGSKAPWKGMARRVRLDAIESSLQLLTDAHKSVEAFAVVVDKQAISPADPVEYAFEEICNRFNLFLSRLWRQNDQQRGLVVMDKSHYEDVLQRLARRFRETGTKWGTLQNLAEVPLFVDSSASRLIQIADLLAWAVWRRYEHHDTRYFDLVTPRFDSRGGVIHGLVHRKVTNEDCTCPACLTRALRDSTNHG